MIKREYVEIPTLFSIEPVPCNLKLSFGFGQISWNNIFWLFVLAFFLYAGITVADIYDSWVFQNQMLQFNAR